VSLTDPQFKSLFARKSLQKLLTEAGDESGGLKRALSATALVALGIGGIIGAGIFVLTGQAAAKYAGPAIVFSFVLSGLASAFSGLCYAEFASAIPIAGSAYTYGYATLGELVAWIIGWDLILEYAFGAATVAVGWAGNLISLLQDHGIFIPPALLAAPGTGVVNFHDKLPGFEALQNRWTELPKIQEHLVNAGFLKLQNGQLDLSSLAANHIEYHSTFLNFPALVGILLVTAILVIGIKESANFNTVVVFLKVALVLVFIALSINYLAQHNWVPMTENWKQFIPPNTGEFGHFGWSGILTGAGVVFFAYIGFDAVSTAAQEAKNPQRDMPIGILGSLAICTVLYILVSGLLTAVVPYTQLNTATPLADGIDLMGVAWGSLLVKVGSVLGLGSVMLVLLLGQSRVLYSMAHDGLLPAWAGKIHERFRTPYVSTIIVGVIVAVISATCPIEDLDAMVSIGTLLAFIIVDAGVWVLRKQQPDLKRAFTTPLVPLVPILGIVTAAAMMYGLPLKTWIRLVAWLIVGLFIYFGYSRHHSKVQKDLAATA
jgi:APA family basic amino acid/polyamine antiporter